MIKVQQYLVKGGTTLVSGAKMVISKINPDRNNGTQEEPSDLFLSTLAESLLLIQLLEAGSWDEAQSKLNDLFAECYAADDLTEEHLLGVYYMLCMSYSYAASCHGRQPGSMFNGASAKFTVKRKSISLKELEQWAVQVLHELKAVQSGPDSDSSPSTVPHRNDIIHHIQQIVQQNLHEDVSLQLLSDKVHLHPKYLSWLYKNETGEGLSDYVYRLKMERAAHFLRHSRKKVYEIASNLGYHHTSYFIRVFKDRFQMTPQQFRDQ
jgi:two-component system response regulator YesN